jgi:uncharacterized protein YajQ (UPF0234 family)
VAFDDRDLSRAGKLHRHGEADGAAAHYRYVEIVFLHRLSGVSLRGAGAIVPSVASRRTLRTQQLPQEAWPMAKMESFDITTGVDLQEVDNAVNQAKKEILQRYDFKGKKAEIDYDRKAAKLTLHAEDQFYLDQMWTVLQGRMISRAVPVKNLKRGNVDQASGGSVRQEITLTQGLSQDIARSIVKYLKDQKLKKVQSAIQGDAVRISSPSRDDLQSVIQMLKEQDYDVELQFGNYRS